MRGFGNTSVRGSVGEIQAPAPMRLQFLGTGVGVPPSLFLRLLSAHRASPLSAIVR